MDVFFTGGYLPFSIAILVFLGLFTIELLLITIGVGLSEAAGTVLPDTDMDGDISFLGHAISFVGFGKVPTTIVLMIIFAVFGVAGTVLQTTWNGLFGFVLPAGIAMVPTTLITLGLTRASTSLIARFMPSVTTSAVSERSLIGRVATITYGIATNKNPAEAEVRDEHGQPHYIQIKACEEDEGFKEGDSVYLCQIDEGFYFGSNRAETLYNYFGKGK